MQYYIQYQFKTPQCQILVGTGVRNMANVLSPYHKMKQELSYRKQIARQLRTQYVEGIYKPKYYIVTLKCGLEVSQGH